MMRLRSRVKCVAWFCLARFVKSVPIEAAGGLRICSHVRASVCYQPVIARGGVAPVSLVRDKAGARGRGGRIWHT